MSDDSTINNVLGPNNYSPVHKLPSMRYKTFEWDNNPIDCTWTCTKTIIKHKYPELDATDLEDYDADGAVITGEGEFFGPSAYDTWMKLVSIFREHGPGEFYHPVFRDIQYAILQKLEAKVEPRENYVSYTFEFWEHRPPNIVITKLSTATTSAATTSSSKGTTKTYGTLYLGSKGSWVIQLQKKLISNGCPLPKYGADGKYGTETEAAVRKYQSKHGLKVDGIAGPQTLSTIGVEYYLTTTASSKVTYRVVSGDNLWNIAKKFYGDGLKYTTIARANNIKNPNVLQVGQSLIIP